MGESVSTESQPPKLCSLIVFPYGFPVKRKSGRSIFGRNLLFWANLRRRGFFHRRRKAGQKVHFSPEDFALIRTKTGVCRSDSSSSQMQGGERVGLFAPITAPQEGPPATICQPRHDHKSEQYPNENESVYHQVADVVFVAGNPLVQGHRSLIFHLREHPFGRVRVCEGQHHRHEGTAAFDQIATGYSPEVDFLLHGDLRGGVAENHQPHVPFRAVENSHLALGAIVEGGHRRWNFRDKFRQAGRSGNVTLAVGHTVLGRQVAWQGGQYGGIHVAQAIEQRAQFGGLRLVPAERKQVVAVNHQQPFPAIPRLRGQRRQLGSGGFRRPLPVERRHAAGGVLQPVAGDREVLAAVLIAGSLGFLEPVLIPDWPVEEGRLHGGGTLPSPDIFRPDGAQAQNGRK